MSKGALIQSLSTKEVEGSPWRNYQMMEKPKILISSTSSSKYRNLLNQLKVSEEFFLVSLIYSRLAVRMFKKHGT